MTQPALKQEIRFCTSGDGLRLAYSTMGKGPALVRYDARGCGLSGRDDAEPTLDTWVADMEAVVDAAGLERFALFGCSQGCPVSVAYAARHPERFSALVLLGGFSRGLMHRDPSPEQVKEFQLLQEMVIMGWGRENPAFRQVFTSIFMPDGSPRQMAWFNELQRVCTTPDYAVKTMEVVSRLDVSELAPQVRCPTLVLHARGRSRERRHFPHADPRRTRPPWPPAQKRNPIAPRRKAWPAGCCAGGRPNAAGPSGRPAACRITDAHNRDSACFLVACGLD